mgnify:FL=1
MYSRLANEKALQAVGPCFLADAKGQAAEHFVLVRNPYARLGSFFKDKFRRNIRNKKPGKICWQDCQRLFFQVLGLDEAADDDIKRQSFLQTTYADFIGCLPGCYLRDAHLQPQYLLLKEIAGLRTAGFHLVHLESKNETAAFAGRSGINLGRKVNSTQTQVSDELEINRALSRALQQKIYDLYEPDFKSLGYTQAGYPFKAGDYRQPAEPSGGICLNT